MPIFIITFLEKFSALATSYIFDIIMALLIIIIGCKLVKIAIKLLNKIKGYENLEDTVRSFLNSFIKIFLYAVVFISAATTLGVPATSFVTILASCGLAVGLALQGSLSNLAGGIMILVFKPFVVGDYIMADGVDGTVKEINIFYTRLTTPDNKVVTIPNGVLSNSTVVDVTANDTRRVDFKIGISYGSDAKKALEILKELGDTNPFALEDPEPAVLVSAYGDSSIELTLRVWAKTSDYWSAMGDINMRVKNEFDKNNIEIPFPQMDVHVKQ